MPYTLDTLEAFVSSAHYDSATADLIASRIPALKAAGQPGEHIAPGITRIHGNLCNVHGKYGPCDKALSGKKKPKKGRQPAKPKQTPQQRAQAHQQQRDQNASDVAKQMAASDAGLSPSGSKALLAFATGAQPDPTIAAGLAQMGLAEQASDGSYRMTPTGRGVVHAMQAGDYQRAIDGISRGTDTTNARQGRQTEHAKRQQDTAGKRTAAQVDRQLRAQAKRQAAQQAKRGSGGSKKPAQPAPEKPSKAAPLKRARRNTAPAVGSVAGASTPKPTPKPARAPKAPAKQLAPALQDAAQSLSDGKELSDDDTQALIRNGLAKLNKDGELILTAAGMRATQKAYTTQARWDGHAWVKDGVIVDEPDQSQFAGYTMEDWDHDRPIRKPSPKAVEAARQQFAKALGVDTVAQPSMFKVFKDAHGQPRWVAQSSTAFQDRDKEIVSTKALADDCAYADRHGEYGPLRWWHTPGLDLGDCDFNAMHGRVLVESGTFRSPAIAQKVAEHANGLEISLGFLHLPSEPDADGVFHHIRRFERSLVPRGKASNRFTAFSVKESRMSFDPTKVAALKALGFSDDDISDLQAQAAATEKAATDQGVAFKADEPAEHPDVIINGITYKAVIAAAPVEGSPEEEAAETPEEEAAEPDAMADDAGGLTLSPEDLSAISDAINQALQSAVTQIMGGLDLEKKVAGHVAGLMAPYQATKDAEAAEAREQLTQLQQQVKELTGDQPARPYRASESTKSAIITDVRLLEAAQKAAGAGTGPFDDIIQGLGLTRPQ